MRKDVARKFVAFSILVSVLAITSSAESNLSSISKKDTLHIIPERVEGASWGGINESLVQDVSEDAVYQNFSKSNSAHFPMSPDSAASGAGFESSAGGESVSDSVDVVGNGDYSSVEIDSSSDIEQPEVVDTSEPQQEPEPAEPAPESQSESAQSEPVSFFSPLPTADFIVAQTTSVYLPLMQASVEETVTPEVVPEEIVDAPVVEAQSEAVDSVENVSSGTETHLEGDVVDGSDVDDGEDVSATQDADEGEASPVPSAVQFDESNSLTFSQFDLPTLESGQFIRNAQLRMSLGAQVTDTTDLSTIEIEYTFGDEWLNAGSVFVDGEASNALNRGYFIASLPNTIHSTEFANFAVRLAYNGNIESLDALYVDALWLEINTETFDRELLKERIQPKMLEHLELPEKYEFLSADLDFTRDELPVFSMRYESQRNPVVQFFRNLFGRDLMEITEVYLNKVSGPRITIHPEVHVTNDGLVTIQLTEEDMVDLQPGAYSVGIVADEGGKTFTDSFEFQWGVLALNPDQNQYALGETSTIMLGAVSENGNTICDAELRLYIIDPEEYISEAFVQPSGQCNGNNFIDTPDYSASYIPEKTGTYEMYVERLDINGDVLAHTHDTFTVVGAQPFTLKREGPTRINPEYEYPMKLVLTAQEDFEGELIERVPGNFTIISTDASVAMVDEMHELRFNVSLRAGESVTYSYVFDAPDISPYLYTLGPAEVMDDSQVVVIREYVEGDEELAMTSVSDVIEGIIDFVTPGEDEVTEEVETVPLEEEIPSPTPSSEESGIDSGTAVPEVNTEGYVGNSEQNADTDSLVSEPLQTDIGSESQATSTEGNVPVEDMYNATGFVEHRKWQIASDATGSALLYWDSATIPSGWTCVSCAPSGVFYQRFVLASSSAGTNGGAATHTHTATGAVSATGATGVSSLGGGGADAAVLGHTHSYTPTISSDSNLPQYRNLVIIQNNSAGEPASIPAGAIAVFDATVPAGWTRYSAQDGNFLRGESTSTVTTTGGSATHTHTISGSTGASNSNTNAPGGSGVSTASNSHTHTVSTTTVAVNHEPPYINVILGKLATTSSATDDMIAMWTDTPPVGWGTVSSTSEPFADRFVKASTTYGGTGGASTHSHANITGIISGTPSANVNRTANAANADGSGTHTHAVSATSFTTVSSIPPYRTAIFAKRSGGASPVAPTLHTPFDSEKSGTSTPQFEFTASDADGSDTLVYQFQWDDDNNLDDSPVGDRTSDNEAGCSPDCFTNTITPADTSPFSEAERIRFSLQSPLTAGTTYYWRTRAKETVGDTWGTWSEVYSYTYEPGRDPSQWYQGEGYQFETDTLTDVATSTEGVVLSVPPPTDALVVYGEGVVQTPRYQLWNGTSWGGELSANSVGGTIQWIRTRAGTTRDEYIVGTQDALSDVNVQIYNATTSSWGTVLEVTAGVSSVNRRGFDVTYETISGDAVVVYCDGDSDPSYRVWNGTSWAGPFGIVTTSALNCNYISLASDPLSDEIIMVTRDTGAAYEAFVWTGSAWGNAQTLGSMSDTDHEGIAIEYEESGDQAMVVTSNGGTSGFSWATWSGTAWDVGTHTLGDDFEWGVLKRDVGTDNMALCYIDNDADIGIVRWNGLSWETNQEIETSGNIFDGRAVSCEYEVSSGRDGYLMIPYSDVTLGRYQVWNGSSFGAGEASVSTISNSWEVGTARTGDGNILSYFHDDANTQFDFSYWNGTSWSLASTLEGSPSVTTAPFKQPIALVAQVYQPAEGTVVSDLISFSSVPGRPTWGEASWSTTEPSGTDVKMQIAYGASCASLVPDGALTGNSTGFDVTASPLDLTGLSTTTYSQLCLKTTLSSTNSSNPTLNDWTLSWEREPYLVQSTYRWYVNETALTPTDPWPVGPVDVLEDEVIDAYAPGLGDVVRLRMGIRDENISLTTSSASFKMQYATSTVCDASSEWKDVGAIGSTTAQWRGYNNSGVSDGATLPSAVLSTTDVLATYEEENNSAVNPNAVSVAEVVEYDWVLEHNAEDATQYCFRMVTENGIALNLYEQYPILTTNASPNPPTLTKLFDNEKTPTTSPQFEFSASDPEGEGLTYQIQIDNDFAFTSTVADKNTVDHENDFENLTSPSDKDPYNTGETIAFQLGSSLSNGVTYYWRVRAQDSEGSGDWGEWSDVYSFTIDTSLTATAWFQTTDAQFDSNTLDDTESSGSGSTVLTGGFTTGTSTSDAIYFEWGSSGNAWGTLTFTDVETSSDLKYKIQYLADDVWTDIPDSDLVGNTSGFDTSPVDLLGLSTDTYPVIRIVAIFTDAGASPTLQEWVLHWGFKILPPTISRLFSNERQATNTPSLAFTAEDPQNDDLVYQVQWSTSYDFSASTTRTSDVHAGFTNIDTPADTTPFNSDEEVQFTIQTADALTDNTTYWWRVRAKDPTGSNSYSDFTDPQSFTVRSTTTVSTWFQTTSEQFLTNAIAGITTTAAQAATVATTAVESLVGYAEGTTQVPRYRTWSGTAWSAEGQALSVDSAISWLTVRPGETREEYVMGTLGTDGDVNMQVYKNGGWGDLQEITTAISNPTARGFDIAYESVSGDAVVVSCDGDADPTYYVWDGSSWTLGGTINLVSSSNCAWIRLIPDTTSDEIILVARDNSSSPYELMVWSGSAWGNATTLGLMNEASHEGIAGAYEESGGQGVVVVSNGVNSSFVWKDWNGSAWSATTTVALGDDFESGTLVSDVGSDNMALCYVDEDNDIGAVRWTGAGFTGQVELDTGWVAGNTVKNDRPVDCAFEVGGARDGYIVVAYSDTTNVRHRAWNGSAWDATETTVSTIQDAARVQLRRTGSNILQLIAYDITNDRYDYSDWAGTTWTAQQSLEIDGNSGAYPFKEGFMIATRNPGSSGTVVGNPGILFTDGSGPYWQELTWVDSEPGGSSILYQIEYYNTTSGTWDLVPDSLLPGNSTGNSTSPIDLRNILPVSTYSQLRPVANLYCNLGTCPTLSDWTLTWAEGITVSGTAQQYDQSTNVTSGTVAVAVNGVLQVGRTGTISGGAWSIANVNTTAGDVVTVFIQGVADGNEAVAVTRYDGVGDITGFTLHERHLTLGSDDVSTTPLTNANIGLYDYTNSEDLFHNATGTALSVCVEAGCMDAEMLIKAGVYYQPAGALTSHDFENNGTFLPEGNIITLSGSWDNNATATMATSTVVFTATSTSETIDNTGAISSAFYNVTFGTGATTAIWTPVTTLDVDNDLTVAYGTLARNGVAITVGGNLTNGASGYWTGMGTTTLDGSGTKTWGDANATLQNVGRVIIDGSSKTIQLAGNVRAHSLTIGADDILDVSVSNYDITVLTDFINNNTFVARSGEVFMSATTTNRIVTAGGDAFYDLTFNGAGGAWSFTESTLSVNNNFTVSQGTLTMPTGTTTIGGSFSATGGTFAHNNATVVFNGTGAKTITQNGGAFTNAFYNLRFSGTGPFSFTESYATTTNDLTITQGAVTFPSAELTVGGSFTQSGGSFVHNSGTVKFTSASAEIIDVSASSFNSLSWSGVGSWSFLDASVTAFGSVWVSQGTVTFPSSTFTIGGSYGNFATVNHNNGTVVFASTDGGETLNFGSSSLYNVTMNGVGGGWSITAPATTTNNFTLATSSSFTLASGQVLSVGNQFTNAVGGASTTWTGSTLSLEAGAYALNAKTQGGDVYGTLRVEPGVQVNMWNSSADTYSVDATGSLYSQDHLGVDGDLYVFGAYTRSSGNEYWSYNTDFDGVDIAGTPRQVDVRFADGASASLTGAQFIVLGTSTATTTVANQGSGTYTIVSAVSTTTLNFYDFTNLGTTGVTLAGTGVVTSLNDGAITPGINAGTGFSLASTLIDANPGFQIQRVNFSTTTAISATNVTQTGGVPSSYWWFRNSSGNIDGEAFDADDGDPGSVRWDDSSLVITVSGTVFSDDGNTPMGAAVCDDATQNVRVVVSGGASYTGSCASANGTFSIGGVVIVGDPVLTVYLDTNGGVKGSVVTKTPTADITDLDIYQNRVVTRHEDVLALTIADMAKYDATDDTDIAFYAATSTTDTLTILSDTELHIASSTTFNPGGVVTINAHASSTVFDGSLHIDDNATYVGFSTSTLTIGGSLTVDAGATFTAGSTTVLMNASTTGKTITTTATQEIGFNELVFDGVGGGWNINGDIRATQNIAVTNGTVTGTSDVTVVNGSLSGNGTLSFGSGTTTLEKSNTLGGTTAWTFGNLVLGSGLTTGTTTPGGATTTVLGKLTISTAHYLNAQSSVWNLAGTGNVFVENGTFIEGTGTVRYSGVGTTNVISTGYYNLDLMALGSSPTYTATGLGITVANNLTIGGATTTIFTLNTNDTALDVNGSVIIAGNGVFEASDSASFTVAGNWESDGVFTGGAGTVTFDGSATTNIAAGSSWFSNVIINGTGAFTVSEHATTSSALTLTSAGSFTLASSQSLAVGGVFTNGLGGGATTWTGGALFLYGGNYAINTSATSDTYETLKVAGGTQIRMWNSGASAYEVSSTGSLYSQDHSGNNGDLYVYGAYTKTSGNDFWSYATDFDGTDISGSPRQVEVFVQGGGSVTYTGGGLAVVGASSASTTVANQGGGAYTLRIGGTASTTWSYYDVADINASGIVFSGTPTVHTLSYGDIEVSQNGGSAMTVGGTVITQNPAKTFTNNYFGTDGAASPAYNVTATGTTVSSWRFTNHSGTIDGEGNDVDPTGDPGYVVWDDSAALITISGNVYSDEGVTVSGVCDGSTNNIVLRVAGLTSYSTSCNAGTGAYAITNVAYSPNDSLIVYIDGEAEKAATVTEDPVSNISDMHVYESRVIVRHEGTDPLSIADMAVWDSSDDADIPFTAVDGSPDTLTLPADRKLIVWTSKEFEPNGNMTISGGGAGGAHDGTLELLSGATFTANAGESHTVGGSLISGVSTSFDADTSTFTFTTTGSSRTIDTNDAVFYNATFNGSGSWTVTNTILGINNDFTITQGAVTLPSATTTVGGSLSVTSGSFNASNGTMAFTATGAESIRAGGSSFGALRIGGAGSFTMLDTNATATASVRVDAGTFTSVSGTFAIGGDFVNAGTFTHGSGVLRFTATTSALVTAGGSDLYTTTFAGSGSYAFTDTNVALLGTLAIQNGAVTLASGTMSIAGSFLNTGGSFDHASGTLLFNSSDTGETINPGSSPFHAVTLGSATGGWTIPSHATTTSAFAIASASNFTLSSGARLTVGGVFTNVVGGGATTWTGSTLAINSGTGYTVNTKTTGGDTYGNVIVGSSTALRAWDSSGTITMADSLSSFYSQDNGGTGGALYIYGNYERTSSADYWSYATDFDGTSLSGSERQVFVSMAANATTTLYGGSLNIVGANGFDTTISNQGSGTYALRVFGGTLNAQYYSLLNMNADGLVFSGTPTITSLTEGNYTLAVNGGSLMTLSSTTLNHNAGLVVSNASFATTSAITGINVELVGTTPSAWYFTNHSGNLDGEVFDVDGGDACGSVRWSDSACLLTLQSGYRFRHDDGGEGVPNSEWYDLDWDKRTRVTMANADATEYTDSAIKLTVPYDSDMQADFDDLRFTGVDGTTLLSHFIESYTASTEAVVWVKVPTLASLADTEVYMYYGNGAVSDTSVATSTFAFADTFEDGNISEYGGDTGEFTVSGSGAYERTYRLVANDPNNGKTDVGGMYNNSYTVSQGETIRVRAYVDTATGSGDEMCTLFGTQNQTTNYAVCLELFGTDRLSLAENVLHRDLSGTVLSSTTVTYSTGWYEIEIDWRTDDSMFVTLSKDGSVVATTSATDSSHTSGGVGYTLWSYHGGWDVFTSRPLLETEPTVSFGGEQVPNGASWSSARNTPRTGVSIADVVRLRFLIENTGTTVTDQNYEIEFAPKGASPSCEAVDYNDYVEVPSQASCGASDICMQGTSYLTNLETTTDLLGGNGLFIPGQAVEDASNNTGNITIQNNEFTELEYVITPTANVTDSSYCFRVTNEGSELDSYTRVAEMGLIFAPNITAVSLNGGMDIALTGGATTTVHATGTVSDMNGYADLAGASTTIFRSGVTESCALDNNNCYISGNSMCSFVNCSGDSCDVSCSADIYYHADPTDIGTFAAETWRAMLSVNDIGGAVATATAPSIDLLTLRAIAVDSSIDYGALAVNSDTGSYNASTSIENIGNDALDVSIEGTDLTNGQSSVIPVSEQIFATSTFTYSACTFCNQLSNIASNFELELSKPASTTPAVVDEIYWGIAIPFGVAGTAHHGSNVFYAVGD